MLKHNLLLLLIVLALLGCDRGPKLYKAGGVVKYQGKALPGADVVFMAEDGASPSIGRTDDSGRFSLVTSGLPGAPAAEYKVSILAVRQKRAVSEAEAVSMTSEQIAANHETLIPVKYNNPISSGLSATVSHKPAANEYTFELR